MLEHLMEESTIASREYLGNFLSTGERKPDGEA